MPINEDELIYKDINILKAVIDFNGSEKLEKARRTYLVFLVIMLFIEFADIEIQSATLAIIVAKIHNPWVVTFGLWLIFFYTLLVYYYLERKELAFFSFKNSKKASFFSNLMFNNLTRQIRNLTKDKNYTGGSGQLISSDDKITVIKFEVDSTPVEILKQIEGFDCESGTYSHTHTPEDIAFLSKVTSLIKPSFCYNYFMYKLPLHIGVVLIGWFILSKIYNLFIGINGEFFFLMLLDQVLALWYSLKMDSLKMSILNNREWALVFWVIILGGIVLIFPKMKEIRKSLKSLVNIFFEKKILIVHSLMLIYMAGIIFCLYKYGLWELSLNQIKDTLIWFCSVGLMSFFRLNTIKVDKNYFWETLIDNFTIIAILEFILNFYTFNFYIEIVLLPVITTIYLMALIAEKDKAHLKVAQFLNGVLAIFGYIILFNAGFKIFTEFKTFANGQTVNDFAITPILTCLFLPFLYLIKIYMIYEISFIRVNYLIKVPKLRTFAKIYALINFNFRTILLNRWISSFTLANANTKDEVKLSIKQILKINKAEKNPKEIPKNEGWSPYKAKDFLKSEGLEADNYHPSIEKWYASSTSLKLGGEIFVNRITYYVEGDEHIAKHLKLVININNKDSSSIAHNKLLSSAKILYKKALDIDLSKQLEDSIVLGKDAELEMGDFKIVIHRENWSESLDKYNVDFIICKNDYKG